MNDKKKAKKKTTREFSVFRYDFSGSEAVLVKRLQLNRHMIISDRVLSAISGGKDVAQPKRL